MYSLAQTAFCGDPNFAVPPQNAMSDREAVDFVVNWMTRELPCVAGRREVIKNRYMIEAATRNTVPEIFARYHQKLQKREAIACLYVFNDPDFLGYDVSVSKVFYYLAEQMQRISQVSTRELANGKALTKKIRLTCPVTELETIYDDFECIAFCPQSNNPADPLYDPLLAMPIPAVNMSSDMFAFSSFVAGMIGQRYKMTVRELAKDRRETERALYGCVDQWHRIATKTITNYESLTDTPLCPIHLNDEQDQWVAGHKDPAFAEQIKEVHSHELPVLYGARIVSQWMEHFYHDGKFSAAGLAREGVVV